jgi:hypothetical protein
VFQNILKWTFKVVVDGVEKELYLHLDGDTSIQAVEHVAMQMIVHCSKIKENQVAQIAAQESASLPAVDIQPQAE